MAKHEGRLELTWTNKQLRLLAHEAVSRSAHGWLLTIPPAMIDHKPLIYRKLSQTLGFKSSWGEASE